MTPKARARALLAAAAVLAAACDILDPGTDRRLGLVMEGPPLSSLVAPDVVSRGVPFQITASTFGSSSCTTPDGYDVTTSPGVYEVRLYDRTLGPAVPCTLDFHNFPRTLTVQFDQAGSAEIRVTGRGDGADGQSPRTIRKTIVVQ